jgi:3-methyladenine DNA glycosylase Mpg
MISSLPGIVVTAAEHAAQAVVIRAAMPIDCSNPDCNIGRRIKLMSCSRKAPVPQARPCQNNASHRLRSYRQNGLAGTPSPLSP